MPTVATSTCVVAPPELCPRWKVPADPLEERGADAGRTSAHPVSGPKLGQHVAPGVTHERRHPTCASRRTRRRLRHGSTNVAFEWPAVRQLLDRDGQARERGATLVSGAGSGWPRAKPWSCRGGI